MKPLFIALVLAVALAIPAYAEAIDPCCKNKESCDPTALLLGCPTVPVQGPAAWQDLVLPPKYRP
jgi:hypothetical protein